MTGSRSTVLFRIHGREETRWKGASEPRRQGFPFEDEFFTAPFDIQDGWQWPVSGLTEASSL
jgi:hypothetical protein